MPIVNAIDPDFLTELLVCPSCKTDLQMKENYLDCENCKEQFEIRDKIPHFIRYAEGNLDKSDPIEHRQDYEQRFLNPKDAAGYRDSFSTIQRNIKRTERELHILNTLLSDQAPCEVALDVPCGGGRLSSPLANKTRYLIEADAAPAQVKLALNSDLHSTERKGFTVSATSLPLKDKSVDGTLCARLSHHFPSAEERETLLKEMLRVSRKFVIFSYTDRWSTQTFFRAIAGRKTNPSTMRPNEISSMARKYGGELQKIMTVFALGSRHRFALIKKT